METVDFAHLNKRLTETSDVRIKDEEINLISTNIKTFVDCEFHQIPKIVSQGTLTFRNCKFFFSPENYCSFAGKDGTVLFENCFFDQGRGVHFSSFKKVDHIGTNSLLNFVFQSVEQVQFFHGDSLEEKRILSLTFKDPKINWFHAETVNISRIDFKHEFFGQFSINGGKIDHISFKKITPKAKVNLSAHNLFDKELMVESFNIDDSYFEGTISFKYMKIGMLNLPNLAPVENRNVLLHSVEIQSRLDLANSFLDGFTFNDVNLEKVELRLGRSFLRNTVFSNIKWPKDHLVHDPISETADKETRRQHYARLREVYQQLKHKSILDNNKLDAMKFHRNEMHAYFEKTKRDSSESRWSRFLLRVDKWVSDFGQNYLKPLIILLVVHFVLSIVIWIIQAGGFIELLNSSFNDGIWDYLYRLNPVHRPMADWSKTVNGIDAFSRFVNGFFIYHFIKASRRYTKTV